MNKRLIFTCCASLFLLVSCNKDNSSSSSTETAILTTVADDKSNISMSMDEIVSCVGNMKNGSMMNSLVAFTGLSKGEALKDEFIESIFLKIEDAVDTISNPIDDKFYFDNYKGTWSYFAADSSWSRSLSPSDKIVIQFPSDDLQFKNNVELVLQGYTDQKFTIDFDDVYLPTYFDLSITKDGIKIAGAELINVVYEQLAEIAIPVNVNASVFISPFTFTINGERETQTKFVAGMKFGDGSGCDYDMDVELNLAHDDYENLGDEDFIDLKGNISHNDLLVNCYLDLKELIKLGSDSDDLTAAEFNSNADMKMLYKSVKIADMVLEESSGDMEMFIQYKDGTKENSSSYYEKLGDDLELLFLDLLGPWDDLDI